MNQAMNQAMNHRNPWHIRSSCLLQGLLAALLGSCATGDPLEAPAPGLQAAPPAAGARLAAAGALRVHPENPRYFTDGSRKAVYLTGSHTWPNFLDMSSSDPPRPFDFAAYLDFLALHNHNFIRLWAWEPAKWTSKNNDAQVIDFVAPQPWVRAGPGEALDGKPRFDLTKLDEDYFQRLRTRVSAAAGRGIFVSIMLFEGWALQFGGDAWQGHPFNPANNTNGIDGDLNGDGIGVEVHTLACPAVTEIQEAYVCKVVDTVNDLDNVLYEIANESHPPSTEWQYHMIRLIHDRERTKLKQHPVGMTFQYKGGSNDALFESPADWISPNLEGGYRDDPPASTGKKVILSDTDHLWGIGGDPAWVWKSFLRGLNPIFMDKYNTADPLSPPDPRWEPVRKSLGYTLAYARRVNLAAMTPRGDLSSTKYCLASPGREYLVWVPSGEVASVDLSAAEGRLAVEWLEPAAGTTIAGVVEGRAVRELRPPFTGDAVLYLRAIPGS
jgi:hypothetical protein